MTMVTDSEKLTTILPYMRAMDEETKKRLERLRQSNGGGVALAGIGYGELLERIYALHARYEKEKEEQCRALAQKMGQIEEKIRQQCADEINILVEKAVSGIKKS